GGGAELPGTDHGRRLRRGARRRLAPPRPRPLRHGRAPGRTHHSLAITDIPCPVAENFPVPRSAPRDPARSRASRVRSRVLVRAPVPAEPAEAPVAQEKVRARGRAVVRAPEPVPERAPARVPAQVRERAPARAWERGQGPSAAAARAPDARARAARSPGLAPSPPGRASGACEDHPRCA